MEKKFICVHGHFYQPPRENPWLNKVEVQDSAYPFHDWNHRINAECYRRNSASRILNAEGKIEDIVNNYAWLSFNIGPTLLAWMENEAPETYEAILEADKESQERFSGHGAALAQAYNHIIMPLANQKDKETQVIWGIEDFKSRYNRFPEGMWLGETAANTESLEMLAKHGIKFTILSPYQANKTRKIGGKEWADATNAKVNTKRPYVCNLPSGNSIAIFFYDGPASQAVAFEGLLNNGQRFADRLLGQFSEDNDGPQLVNIATDGESYGHHHKLGEMALSYCLNTIDEGEEAELTIYGEFLEKFPPEYEVEIIENTSWSCYHGVERWRSDCGCNTGGHDDWNQKWRGPLRDSFDWVREKLITLYEAEMGNFTSEPWEVRNKYIQVVFNRDPENVSNFLNENFKDLSEEDEIKILKLLEMQYHAMLMYTSCGWFFDEVTGIESMQDIFYAARAVQLAEEISGNEYEPEFEELLKKVPSNLPEYDNVQVAYSKFVKPMALNMIRIGAHYAVSSIFNEFPEEINLYNFSATVKSRNHYEAGKQKLIIGHSEFRSYITREKVDIAYAVLHLGEYHLVGGVRTYIGAEALEEVHLKAAEFFKKGNIYEIFFMIDTYFGNHNYSFWHLFRDEQRQIMEVIMENNMVVSEGIMQQVYDNNYPLLRALRELDMQVPNSLRLPVEYALNSKLIRVLKQDDFNLKEFKKLIQSVTLVNVSLDSVTLNFLTDKLLERLTHKFEKEPENIELLNCLTEIVEQLQNSAIKPNKWEAQNVVFDVKVDHYDQFNEKAENGEEQAKEWVTAFQSLADKFNLVV